MLFDEKVYQFCSRIPSGRVSTYGEIAKAIGKPGSSRAVGQSLKRNPYAPRVPCHRVVKSDGSLGGYGGTGKDKTEKKQKMLEKEGIETVNGRVNKNYFYRF
jgi:O-6-methylguanine DNA methyltransferase